MTLGAYILGPDGRTPIPTPDLDTWARWFETMSRLGNGDWGDEYFARYCTWDEAEAGHAEIVRKALEHIEHAAAMLSEALVPARSISDGDDAAPGAAADAGSALDRRGARR